MRTVRRFDSITVPKRDAEITPEGFLRAPARISRVGVYEYADENGKITRELRLREDVFDPGSLASFSMNPITDGHPACGEVNAENARDLTRGTLGENVTIEDDRFVAARVLITDADLVKKVMDGDAVELSAGYGCVIVDGAGVHEEFGEYDCRQTKIRSNHVAVVSTGRAGPEVRVRLDAGDARSVVRKSTDSGDATSAPPSQVQEATMKITLRGASVEVPDTVAALFEAERQDAASVLAARDATIADLTGKVTTTTGLVSEVQARADSLDARVKRLDAWVPICFGRMLYSSCMACMACPSKSECASVQGYAVPGDPPTMKTDAADAKPITAKDDPKRLDGLKAFEAKILDGARARADLEEFAKKAGVEFKADAADVEIRRDVAAKLSGLDLKDKPAEYVAALFDVERKRFDEKPTGSAGVVIEPAVTPKNDEGDEKVATDRRQDMARRDAEAWKKPAPGAVTK
jgi:hypothetical protein